MPELPDIEGFRRMLHDHAAGEVISAVEIHDPGIIKGRSAQDFVRHLEGRHFREPHRRGKWLLGHLDGMTALFHFGMTGRLLWQRPDAQRLRFDRVDIHVGKGKLVFQDQRKLRGIWLADNEAGIVAVIGEQGPDALGLTGRRLAECLASRSGALKPVLMDQRVVAGLGNMLSDEVLWRARIHPASRYCDLGAREQTELDRAMQGVLRASVKLGAIPRRATWLSSQRSEPEPHCPRCHSVLSTSRIGGRTSYWCAVCQPLSN